MEDSLYAFLVAHLPGCGITRQYGHDRLRADIVIEDVVAIELKHGLASTSEFHRLVGQVESYARWGVKLVVVLTGRADPDMVHRVGDHVAQRFSSLDARLVLKVVK